MHPFSNIQVQAVYELYPSLQKNALLNFRELVFKTAEKIEAVGDIQEDLKWGQPSFITKTGSTFRIDKVKDSEKVAIYFICTTGLVDQFRELYSDDLNFVGNRAIEFEIGEPYDEEALAHCISIALTYKIKRN